ncbi:uncharacterized protein [Hyperolius riggenbachi]|uniref:uncharacterized protein n=1 Tax=Hyperolius riggenbachi TaxID=752182 RepID=UPI0035A27234
MNSASSSLGLLSGYNSSSSDEEEATENTSESAPSKVNFFADAASSSDDEDVGKREMTEKPADPFPSLPSPLLTVRLPAPCLGKHGGGNPGGVFSNPFQDEQQAQLSILERHVKLSDSNWSKGGKGVCLAYQRDGRCRYGTKCKYSHGSDLPPGATVPAQGELVGSSDTLEVKDPGGKTGDVHCGEEVGEEIPAEKGKRKKPGLTNTLIPPKKSMKNYQKQLSSERPWAV